MATVQGKGVRNMIEWTAIDYLFSVATVLMIVGIIWSEWE